MLSNFLHALPHPQTTRRILLVTGCKHYGVHLGQPKNPLLETDPWLTDAPFPPNFYYRQQTILRDFCASHQHLSWTVTYPNDVIGFAHPEGNFMNLASTLGLYAAVTKELQHGRRSDVDEPAEITFPGSETCYTRFDTFTSSKLHAQFCEWAVTEPKAAGQAFNVVDGDAQSWQDLWPRLARRFGMRVRADQFDADSDSGSEAAGARVELGDVAPPPVSVVAEEIGLRGRVRGSVLEQRVCSARWSERGDVKAAWERLAAREGLRGDAFGKATWGFVDFVLGRNYDVVASMSKAREAGWTG